ncbi:MAG TPA: hypothetical protein VMG32_01610 [Anaeromyxobacteraceae bacterium]|nr:hypothetical protein [Anaeromyxobacteraceae bacterium]
MTRVLAARKARSFAFLALLLGAARAEEPAAQDGGVFRSDVHTVVGRIASFSWADRVLSIEAPEGPLTLTVDRNTAIFREDRYGSPRDLVAGARVRAAYGEGGLAYWIEVRRSRGEVDEGAAPSGPERAPPAAADGGAPPGEDGGLPVAH